LIESVASNVPRLDYTNGSCPSILVEPQRTNLALRSQEFDSGVWLLLNSATVSSNTVNSPDGTQNADTINFGSSDSSLVYQNLIVGSNTYTLSLYAKSSTNKKFRFRNFTGTTVIFSSEFTTTNQWQKFTYTFTDSLFNIGIMNEIAGGVGSIDVYGAQLEAGSYATSYIPTTSASVTRNADQIQKSSISSLIGQTEGTIFVDFYHDGINTFYPCSISNGSYTDAIYFEQYLGRIYGVVFDNGSLQFAFDAGVLSIGRHKMAIGYKTNDTVFYIDGVLKYTDTSLTVPDCSRFYIGFVGGVSIDKSVVNSTALWKTRLTNTQIAQLTTI
jgi:hypothetical protein